MLTLGVQIAANNPTTPKGQAEATATLTEAKKSSILIPRHAIEQAGKTFIGAAADDAKAWGVALEFISYHTLLNAAHRPKVNNQPVPNVEQTRLFLQEGAGKPHPVITGDITDSLPRDQSSRFETLGQALNSNVGNGPAWIFLTGGAVGLDGMRVRRIVLDRVEVHYGGKPVILENVVFVNCTFIIDNNDRGRQLALALLSSSSVNFRSLG
jgi:hypothetical protein